MAKKQIHSTKGLRPPIKHSKSAALKVYWPYIPLIVIMCGGLFLNVWQPLQGNQPATLAYATEMSRSGLLSSTNSQRNNNGSASLILNDKLNAAAQNKANDMVARNYWSHNTPDGQEPWIFIDAQGYGYTKAGENLAYGFSTSDATIVGWMNSSSHRANMLDAAFSEVGFGFANSSNFVSSGEQTVVVAMYATPVLAATTPPPEPAPVSAPEPAPTPVQQPQTQTATNTPQQSTPAPEPPPEKPVEEKTIRIIEDTTKQPVTTESAVPEELQSQRITLLQQLTGGRAPWSPVVVSSIGFGLAVIWLLRHMVLVRRFIVSGEHFVAHHPVLDLIVVTIVALAVYLSQSSGVVL